MNNNKYNLNQDQIESAYHALLGFQLAVMDENEEEKGRWREVLYFSLGIGFGKFNIPSDEELEKNLIFVGDEVCPEDKIIQNMNYLLDNSH